LGDFSITERNQMTSLAAAQSERVLTALRRMRGTPQHSAYMADLKEGKVLFFKEMLGAAAPTNSMGLSSTTHSTGAIDTFDKPLKRKARKRSLRQILPGVFRELVGSMVGDPGVPRNPIMVPTPRKKRPTKKTPVIFNPQLKA
jgi:hypothetical protein